MLTRLFYWVYLRLIRPITSPLIYWVVRFIIKPTLAEAVWPVAREKNAREFSEMVNSGEYYRDPLKGLLDFSPREPEFFWVSRKVGRDCGHWSRMWYWWAEYNNYRAWEVFIVDDYYINSAHLFTIYYDGDYYVLANYQIVGYYDSFDDAVREFSEKSLVSYGLYRDPIYFIVSKSEG